MAKLAPVAQNKSKRETLPATDDNLVLAQSVVSEARRRGRREVSFRPRGGSEITSVPAVVDSVLQQIRLGLLPAF